MENITQDSVRGKLVEKCRGLKIKFIAEQTGIPREIISAFKNKRRELWEESLIKLDVFLNKYDV
ncbi:MAG: hypothetical protein HFH43_04280 [Lachnospiraceae bacterium]|nr:hypothetical protein [Lachnospiraceae bacterium]